MKLDSALTFVAVIAVSGAVAHAGLWSPASIDTVAWYDASDATTITTGGPNGYVTDWADKSGNGVHLTQGNDGDRPSVVASAMNGLNVLEFANKTEDMDAIVGGNPVLISATWVAVVLQYNRVRPPFLSRWIAKRCRWRQLHRPVPWGM